MKSDKKYKYANEYANKKAKEIREKRGLTRIKVAAGAGIGYSAYRAIELGQNAVTRENIERLATYYNKSRNYFFKADGEEVEEGAALMGNSFWMEQLIKVNVRIEFLEKRVEELECNSHPPQEVRNQKKKKPV